MNIKKTIEGWFVKTKKDNEERRLVTERRKFLYSKHYPERRFGRERRSGRDRRQT
jgi:hypothetical protein